MRLNTRPKVWPSRRSGNASTCSKGTLEIMTGMWNTPIGETFDYSGRMLTIKSSPALPKPAQRPGPPIIMGGAGPRRTPRLAARFCHRVQRPVHVAGEMGRK
ncbi:MAG: hypothetical protein CM1200mP26_28300 [Acidimicrobiales bacterium]|nr:MAG: hypothetical protein CM1200mP26_28300 [Acidimicrobiales bacterium]